MQTQTKTKITLEEMEQKRQDALPPLLKPPSKPLPKWKRILYFAGGVLCILVGFVGWLLPVVSGIPFYLGGAILLGIGSPRVRALINKLDEKFPYKIRKKLRSFQKRFEKKSS